MAKKADSAFEGTFLQIKRTNLDINDTVTPIGGTSPQSKINNDGILDFGEFMYLDVPQAQKLLIVGDSTGSTLTSNLQVFSSENRALSPNKIYCKHNTGDSSNRISLVDLSNNPVFIKQRAFTSRNSSGIPIDSSSQIIQVTTNGEWVTVDSDGNPTQTPASETTFPKAQKIAVTGFTIDTIPFIGLALSNAQLLSGITAKQQKKSFANITAVSSFNGGIIVYCCYKNIFSNVYIDVYGG